MAQLNRVRFLAQMAARAELVAAAVELTIKTVPLVWVEQALMEMMELTV